MSGAAEQEQPKCFELKDEAELPQIVSDLGITEKRPVILVIGGADHMGATEFDSIAFRMRTTIAPLADQLAAVVITGGTDTGVMKIVGSVFATHAPRAQLVGVAPSSRIAPAGTVPSDSQATGEKHHDLVLVPGSDFGDESPYLIKLIEEVAGDSRILALVAGGGDGTALEFEYCKRRGWPVLVLAGSGGVADELAELASGRPTDYKNRVGRISNESEPPRADARLRKDELLPAKSRRRDRPRQLTQAMSDRRPRFTPSRKRSSHAPPANAAARVSDTNPRLCAVALESPCLNRMIQWPLADTAVLKTAWSQAAFLDARAKEAQPPFRFIRLLILLLGVVMTSIAVLWVGPTIGQAGPAADQRIPAVVLAGLAGVTSGLLTWVSRRQKDQNWISLRGASEALLREIFRFRCSADLYAEAGNEQETLARRITVIGADQARAVPGFSGPSTPEFWPPQAVWGIATDQDPLLDSLSKKEYIEYRLNDQIDYFARTSSKDDRKVAFAVAVSLTLAFAAAVFAATQSPWLLSSIAILSSAISATAAWLALDRSEDRVQRMSTTSAGLRAILLDWEARDGAGANRTQVMQQAVTKAEKALEEENMEWRRGLLQAQELLTTVAATPNS